MTQFELRGHQPDCQRSNDEPVRFPSPASHVSYRNQSTCQQVANKFLFAGFEQASVSQLADFSYWFSDVALGMLAVRGGPVKGPSTILLTFFASRPTSKAALPEPLGSTTFAAKLESFSLFPAVGQGHSRAFFHAICRKGVGEYVPVELRVRNGVW